MMITVRSPGGASTNGQLGSLQAIDSDCLHNRQLIATVYTIVNCVEMVGIYFNRERERRLDKDKYPQV